jgi:hypothetical protein
VESRRTRFLLGEFVTPLRAAQQHLPDVNAIIGGIVDEKDVEWGRDVHDEFKLKRAM